MKVTNKELSEAIFALLKIAKRLKAREKADLIKLTRQLERAYSRKDYKQVRNLVERISRTLIQQR